MAATTKPKLTAREQYRRAFPFRTALGGHAIGAFLGGIRRWIP